MRLHDDPDFAAPSAGGNRSLAGLVRVFVAVNAVAIGLALLLGGPGGERAQAAAEAVWSWCSIG